ncbi:MAG: hypothetical protein RRY79_01365 [Clostridia bacterium]
MMHNTIVKDGKKTIEKLYFIGTLPFNAKEIARALRGHWTVGSYHWHLDMTFREGENRNIEKQTTYSLNIIRK